MTTWRPIPDHPGYEASGDGQLRSWRGNRWTPRATAPKVLRPTLDKQTGYYTVRLATASSSQFVHRLVAAAFLGSCAPGIEVRHLDGTRTNNAVENLAYGTRAENIADMLEHGTHPSQRTHCSKGHEYTEGNTRYSRSGKRICRACRKATKRRLYERTYGETVTCPNCGAEGQAWNLHRHRKTEKCRTAGSNPVHVASYVDAERMEDQ